ncbi:hypothetical protein BM1374165_00315 [Bartonella henselae]|uniref:Uncharacterized protein n=2 Tax=Bartonella henselae TaxID=38323 RepID=X5M642_BARHN|nr:hypothetical protein BM1374165_00315 [Bartonella henselae]
MARTQYRAEEDDDEKIVDVINEDEEDENKSDIDEDFDEDEDEDEDKQESVKAALEKERKRGEALTNLERQAKRLGVSFDAAKAIKSGMSVEKAKNVVLTAAVSKSASLKLSTTAPHRDGTSKEKIHAKWETAWRAIK